MATPEPVADPAAVAAAYAAATAPDPRLSPAVSWMLGLSGWLALATWLLPPADPARVAATFGFVLVCPGMALVRFLRRSDPLEEFVAGLAVSISLAITVTVFMATGRWWHPGVAMAVLAAVTTGAVVVLERQARRAARLREAPAGEDPGAEEDEA